MPRSHSRQLSRAKSGCPELVYRRLAPSDVTEYRRLRLYGLRESPAAFGSSFEEESKRPLPMFVGRLESSDGQWTIGALAGKRLAGVVSLVRDPSLKRRHRAAIYGMYVAPGWRRKGVGRELICRAIAVAESLAGVKQLHLGVVSSNRPALRLYESVGFVSYGEEPRALFIRGRYYAERFLWLRLTSP